MTGQSRQDSRDSTADDRIAMEGQTWKTTTIGQQQQEGDDSAVTTGRSRQGSHGRTATTDSHNNSRDRTDKTSLAKT